MERNDDNIANLGSSGSADNPYSADTGLGGTTGSVGSTGATGSNFSGTTPGADAAADRARELAGGTRERLADAGATLREKAGTARSSLADMLEAGANRLNSQAGSTQLAGATGTGTVAGDGNRIAAVAGGLQGSADWLREADLDSIKQGVENQVRTNPGRTLLIAAGLGYLLGKAFRR